MFLSGTEAYRRYGPVVGGVWLAEAKFCVRLVVPPDIAANWINSATGKLTTHIYCNRDIADSLLKALQNVRDRKLIDQLETFGGCFSVRDVRGIAGRLSAHAYALAIDINEATNRLGTPGDMTDELAACFTDEQFAWGKDFKRLDPMHFSLSWE